jgi:hypothetical protein
VGRNSPATTGPSFKTTADLTNDRVVPPCTSAARRFSARVGSLLSASGRARLPLLPPMIATALLLAPLPPPSAARSHTTRSIAAMLPSAPALSLPVLAAFVGPLSSPALAAAACWGWNFRQLPARLLPAPDSHCSVIASWTALACALSAARRTSALASAWAFCSASLVSHALCSSSSSRSKLLCAGTPLHLGRAAAGFGTLWARHACCPASSFSAS